VEIRAGLFGTAAVVAGGQRRYPYGHDNDMQRCLG
jgi:hypothetical protein